MSVSGATWLYRYPLKFSLPVGLALVALVFFFVYVFNLWQAHRDALIFDAREAITSDVTRLQRQFQYLVDHGDNAQLQEEMAYMGADLRVRIAAVLDERQHVIASTSRTDLVGSNNGDALARAGLESVSNKLWPLLDELRREQAVDSWLFTEQGVLLAAAPLTMGRTPESLSGQQEAMIVLGWDLEALYWTALEKTLITTAKFAPVAIIGIVVIGFILHVMLARRLDLLAHTAEQLAAGDLGVRSALFGSDEVGRLARAFNEMSDTLGLQWGRLQESERRLSLSQTFSGIGTWEWDIGSGVLVLTATTYRLLGLPPNSQVSFGQFLELLDPVDAQRLRQAMDATLSQGKPLSAVYGLELATGEQRWLMQRGDVLRDEHGAPQRMYGVLQDITPQKQAEFALYREKEKAQVTLASIVDGVVTTDTEGRISYMNPVAEQLTGWEAMEAQGRPVGEVVCLLDDMTHEPLDNPLHRVLHDGRSVGLPGQALLRSLRGGESVVEESMAPLRDRDGTILGAVLVLHDVTEAREMALRITWQATHDSLTGLVNRAAFEDQLRTLLRGADNREHNKIHTLLYIDLDQFKVVNDIAGHVAGDELLKQVCGLMQQHVGERDVLARLGGDEFGLILDDCRIAKARLVAERLHQSVDSFRFAWNDRVFRIGLSIGALEFQAGEGNLSDLMSAADLACYAAKNSGRGRTHIYATEDAYLQQHRSEMDWAARVNEAVEDDRLELWGQRLMCINPICAEPGLHFEVLVRLRDENGNLVAPGVFLPAAERYDLMAIVDRWIINKSFAMVAEHLRRRGGKGIAQCAINLSGISLGSEQLLPYVRSKLEEYALPPEVFCFEITETAAISNYQTALRFIREIKGLGCRFALDDFGSGLSSFSYLRNLPVDYLKIDGSFVRGICSDPVNRALVGNINSIGHLLGKRTIAEYAEDESTIALLRELAVDYAQGYGVSRPEPLADMLRAAEGGLRV